MKKMRRLFYLCFIVHTRRNVQINIKQIITQVRSQSFGKYICILTMKSLKNGPSEYVYLHLNIEQVKSLKNTY